MTPLKNNPDDVPRGSNFKSVTQILYGLKDNGLMKDAIVLTLTYFIFITCLQIHTTWSNRRETAEWEQSGWIDWLCIKFSWGTQNWENISVFFSLILHSSCKYCRCIITFYRYISIITLLTWHLILTAQHRGAIVLYLSSHGRSITLCEMKILPLILDCVQFCLWLQWPTTVI